MYVRGNPVMRVDLNGMWDDNYTIFADGTMSKEETDDDYNTYTVYDSQGNEVFYNKTDVVKNDKGEDMVRATNGSSEGGNALYKWTDISDKRDRSYLEEDAYAAFLGACINFYETASQDVDKVNVWQFMSLNREHSGHFNRTANIDVFFYNTSGETMRAGIPRVTGNNFMTLTNDADFSSALNRRLIKSFTLYGLGSHRVFTSNGPGSGTAVFRDISSGLAGHHNHAHFQGFNGRFTNQLPTVPIFTNKLYYPIRQTR
jgi:hypothetical protein